MTKKVEHFFYSEEQAFIESNLKEKKERNFSYNGEERTHFNTFINEDGKEKIYTEIRMVEEGDKPKPNDNFSDVEYLGTGSIYKVSGTMLYGKENIQITEHVKDASYLYFKQNTNIKHIKHNNVEIESDPALESLTTNKYFQSQGNTHSDDDSELEMPKFLKQSSSVETVQNVFNKIKSKKLK